MNLRKHFAYAFFASILMHPLIAKAGDSEELLKDLAIISTLTGWLITSINRKNPVEEAIKIEKNSHIFGFSQGSENKNTFNQLYYGKKIKTPIRISRKVELHGHWELGIDTWKSSINQSDTPHGEILRAIPIYSLHPTTDPKLSPYMEFGIGLSYLSSSKIENTEKSSQFQFIEHLGAGLYFKQFKIGYRFTHISNGGLSLPNPATDIHSLNISYEGF